MAIVNNGTVNSLDSALLPSGYSRPTVTEISDYTYVSELTLSVLKATVDESSKSDTMTAIIANGTVGITQQVDDILAADYIASQTVTAYTEWYKVSSNIEVNTTSDFFNDTAVSYECYVRLYVKVV
jgi:hypothetical protein